MNPIAFICALPLLLIMGVALLIGWLIIKAVELIPEADGSSRGTGPGKQRAGEMLNLLLFFQAPSPVPPISDWLSLAQNAPWSIDGVKQAWLVMFGSILYAVLCWRGSAIAAQLLGGGPNLSHSEVFQAMGTAMQAAAAAALVATGVGGAAVGAMGRGSAATAAGSISGAGAAAASAGSAGAAGSTPASRTPTSSNGNGAYQAANAVAGALHGVAGGGTHQVQPPAFKGLSE